MPLTRRDFFKGVGLATGGLVLERLLWTHPGLPPLPGALPEGAESYNALGECARAVLARVDRLIGDDWAPVYVKADPRRLGDTVSLVRRGPVDARVVPITLDRLFGVDLPDWLRTREDVDREVDLIANGLFGMVRRYQVDVFVGLPELFGNAEVLNVWNNRVGLRAIRAYDVVRDRMIVRFDMMGGQTPEAQRRSERIRQGDLAKRIRERVTFHRASGRTVYPRLG